MHVVQKRGGSQNDSKELSFSQDTLFGTLSTFGTLSHAETHTSNHTTFVNTIQTIERPTIKIIFLSASIHSNDVVVRSTSCHILLYRDFIIRYTSDQKRIPMWNDGSINKFILLPTDLMELTAL